MAASETTPLLAAAVKDVESGQTEEPALSIRLFVVLSGLYVGVFLAALDGTIAATLVSVIGSEFNCSNSIGWMGTAFLLTQTSFSPLYGKLSDIFGRKPAALFASAVFGVGSLLCGIAQTYPQLVAARAVAGIGAGGLLPMSSIVSSDLVPLRKRGVLQGIGSSVFGLGAAVGPPLGGWLGDNYGWRLCFLLQVPLCVLQFVLIYENVNIPAGPGDMMTKLKRIDYLGSVTLVTAVSLLLVGLSMGGNQRPWSDSVVTGSLVGGAVALAAFFLVELYVAKEPLMAPRILFTRTPGFVAMSNWAISISQYMIIFTVPVYFVAVEGRSTGYAGMHLIPNAVGGSVCALVAGLIIAHNGYYKKLLIGMGVLHIIGPFRMSLWHRDSTPDWLYWLDMIPAGLAQGGIVMVTLLAVIAAVPKEDMAAATGTSLLARATGSVLGVALSSTILQNSLARELPRLITGKNATEIILEIRRDVQAIKSLPAGLHEAAVQAYQTSMRDVFMATTLAAGVAFVALAFIGEHKLPGRLDRK